jgi:hypothetical protein
LLIQVSKPPKRCTAISAMRRTSCSLATSATTVAISPPGSRIRSAAVRSPSALRAASTTRAPRPAARRAVAKPMPLEAPVITIV